MVRIFGVLCISFLDIADERMFSEEYVMLEQREELPESDLSAVSDTLYIPLLGRIYASKRYPEILYDEKAVSLWDRLPSTVQNMPGQTEYTLLASAIRSATIDRCIRFFLNQHSDGTIVNVGCGLETAYFRNDNAKTIWFELDLPEVLAVRSRYFPEQSRDRFLAYSLFDPEWMSIVQNVAKGPIMVIAAGIFYYFTEKQILDFINQLSALKPVELVFDAVSSMGIKGSRYYVKKSGKQDATMYFSVDKAELLAKKALCPVKVMEERKYFSLVSKAAGFSFSTKSKMILSDLLNMVKMIQLEIG